jgi:hypothetical protein
VVSGLESITDPGSALAAAANARLDRNMLPHPEGKSRG